MAYDGPSQINGERVLGIVTWNSRNAKTGDMNQLWILLAERNPWEALRAGKDEGICGTCPLRAGHGCYVQVPQAPLSIWKSWKRGGYPTTLEYQHMTRRPTRLGAYGDPAALPRRVIEDLVEASPQGWTGFSHQWRELRFRWLREYCMASVQSPMEAFEAGMRGWRTFRVKQPESPRAPMIESVCPASDEAGKLLNCATCLKCSGHRGKGRGSVTIDVHGPHYIRRAAGEHVA